MTGTAMSKQKDRRERLSYARRIGDAITRRTSAFRDRPRGLGSARLAQETEDCCARRLIETSYAFRKDRRTILI